jgi:hypothetical protein
MQYHLLCHCIERNVILSIIQPTNVRVGTSALHLGTVLLFGRLWGKLQQRPECSLLFREVNNQGFAKLIPSSPGRTAPSWPRHLHYLGFTITPRHITLGKIPLDEWSAGRRDLYLTIHNTHNRQISMPPAAPKSQQASGSRPTPQTARPLGPATKLARMFTIFYLNKTSK